MIARAAVGSLVRTVVLVAVVAIYVAVLNESDSTDPLSAGLLAFLILVSIAFVWALVDGVRRGLVAALVGWLLTSVLAGVAIPATLSVVNDADLGVSDAVFFAILLAVPAFGGLLIGGLVHRTRDHDGSVAAG
ncbi:hypothetical protein [Nocardioides caricicola]|uniref:Histidine kinase n=1 Tax=Nocardioides caricicola TaxID=634770 RepID=A0ABW0N6J8_9ACTN